MIQIEITEEVENMNELEYLLEEVLRRVRSGTWRSYDPDFVITGDEEDSVDDSNEGT